MLKIDQGARDKTIMPGEIGIAQFLYPESSDMYLDSRKKRTDQSIDFYKYN